jgi:hypothetical protein
MKTLTKSIMCMCVVMVVISLCVSCSYSQDKPSNDEMISIIVSINKSKSPYPYFNFINIKPILFKITNSFTSSKNGRYCIEVDYKYSFDLFDGGNPDNPANKNPDNKNISAEGANERFSFEKKGNKWYGWGGWGPGE